MEKVRLVKLDVIKWDAGTQVRAFRDPEIQSAYAELMKQGVEFPPIVLFFDGANYYIGDGFTRYFARKDAGFTDITAIIKPGNLEDAILFACQVNCRHGQPLSKEDRKAALKRLGEIGYFSQHTYKDAAQLLACSERTVLRLLSEDEENKLKEKQKQEARAKRDIYRILKEEGDIQEELGITPKLELSERDELGVVIPTRLESIWQHRRRMKEIMSACRAVLKLYQKAKKEMPEAWIYLNENAFVSDVNNVLRHLAAALPYAVCRFCGGENEQCKACKGSGWMNEMRYKTCPPELQVKKG